MKWQELERYVRTVASAKWSAAAEPEEINGVRMDCVLKIKSDYWVLIEITQEKTLNKLREDIAKLASVRHYLFAKDIYSECFFVCEGEPNPSLKQTGDGQNVTVLSKDAFEKHFFDFEGYAYSRNRRKFGSAVNPVSGDNDTQSYVPVGYQGVSESKEYTLLDIAKLFCKGKRIVLLGNYGTGKSRFIKELFLFCSDDRPSRVFYPIAIDLRDNWGTRRGHEIIQRHFDGLGLSSQGGAICRVLGEASLAFLLDGFDEIGSQAWSDDSARLSQIRAESLLGVKDLIKSTRGGIVITGREHYFNSEEEMFNCLGLEPSKTIIIKCAEEFTDHEMQAYLQTINPSLKLPSWLPRRPLICQIISDMGEDALKLLALKETGETSFWNSLISVLCERESRIHSTLDGNTIKRVLRRIARMTRTKNENVGPISITEINQSFEIVTGRRPVDESAVMLQRLPGLGRIASESTDRQFVDEYILDGLRAEDVMYEGIEGDSGVLNEKWINPLSRFGLTLVANDMVKASDINIYYLILKRASERQNKTLAADVLSAMLCSGADLKEFECLYLSDAHIDFLDLSHRNIAGISIVSSFINELDMTECQAKNVLIKDCIIKKIYGVSAAKGLPQWFEGNVVGQYEAVNTVARIRRAELKQNHLIFVTLIKKLFFQPGSGRKEEALLRGLGESADRKTADRIIKLLIKEQIVTSFRGKEGNVYTPNRKYARRMETIFTKLTLSDDPLWETIGNF